MTTTLKLPTTVHQAYAARFIASHLTKDDDPEGAGAEMVAQALIDFAHAAETLVKATETVTDRAACTREYVQAGLSVNSLGELQGSALSMDRACALYQARAEAVATAIYFAQQVGVTDATIDSMFAAMAEATA
jgi:hypothetical protein